MGCGMHCFVERKNQDGIWETLKMSQLTEKDLEYMAKTPDMAPYYEEDEWMLAVQQNYFLFAILADVRNYWRRDNIEIQGCQVIPICEPKGLPIDVTERVKKASDRAGRDGHSHTYLDLSEIMSYSWGQIRICEESLTDAEYEHYLRYGDIERETIFSADDDFKEIFTSEQLKTLSDKWMEYYDRLKKRTIFFTYGYCCREFLHVQVPKLMAKLGEVSTNLEDIRLVFWFDN